MLVTSLADALTRMFGTQIANADLLEADVGDVSQCTLDDVYPLFLPQWVLLRADDIDVMRDLIGCVIPCLPLAL